VRARSNSSSSTTVALRLVNAASSALNNLASITIISGAHCVNSSKPTAESTTAPRNPGTRCGLAEAARIAESD